MNNQMQFTDMQLYGEIKNIVIYNSIIKTQNVFNRHKRIAVSLSGGADSDVVLDLISRIKFDDHVEIRYIFFNTGIEWDATHKHLDFLENKYFIKIERLKIKKPIPSTVINKGQPFLNKHVSEMISRLQHHDFKWQDENFEQLIVKYPNCKIALNWWTNNNPEGSFFNIDQNKALKQFMLLNNPDFKISGHCCKGAKKDPSANFVKENKTDLMVIGIRRAEGGLRSKAYISCYSEKEDYVDVYLPIFWYLDQTKEDYENEFNVIHSECYTKYGLKRTGCAGCPFGREFDNELKMLEQYEPKLHKAVSNIFKDSYNYTRSYNLFKNSL